MSARPFLLAGLLAALYVYAKQRGVFTYGSGSGGAALTDASGVSESNALTLDTLVNAVTTLGNTWDNPPPGIGPLFSVAEGSYGIPPGTLQKMGFLESHWRNDIITGVKRSPAGAVGIMQFLPTTAASLGIDPLNVAQAIDGAGKYLRTLYNRFYDWNAAVAAYNWGQGNVNHAITSQGADWLSTAPAETQNYVAFAAPDSSSGFV